MISSYQTNLEFKIMSMNYMLNSKNYCYSFFRTFAGLVEAALKVTNPELIITNSSIAIVAVMKMIGLILTW